jgi:hypothetical protein
MSVLVPMADMICAVEAKSAVIAVVLSTVAR